ncbi:hypothetical protein A3B35_02595 [Candidatus Kaiserbacteria bacterium RIFCSPLOWO2_01_FULL_54_24]|uniref:Right handed beta helix domain-containing protein n=1 Tax=Candidatus Kaiserbacteria bacterium RIFCSPLOWO2_01_FULL_54_24 TaxID=1798515 RepID=A0A1F6EVN0_9BACT|nr:MAG: hypothetical protein A3B35_02595 [Candidatus Kaiserbacteria bacterium RIFCSPLOWO2_01_FULL_54_24]
MKVVSVCRFAGTLFFVLLTSIFAMSLSAPQAHADVFIQSPGGGGCSRVGEWNAATLTCTLTQDVVEPVIIYFSSLVTLDGADHTIDVSDRFDGRGVWVRESFGAKVRNVRVQGAGIGIYVYRSGSVTIASSTVESSFLGIYAADSSAVSVEDNTVSGTEDALMFEGISAFFAPHISVNRNRVGPHVEKGIATDRADNSTFENNVIDDAATGFAIERTNDSSMFWNSVTGSDTIAFAIQTEDSLRNVVRNNTFEHNALALRVRGPSDFPGPILSNARTAPSWAKLFVWAQTIQSATRGVLAFLRSVVAPVALAQSDDDNIFFGNEFLQNDTPAQIDASALARFFKPPPIGGNHWDTFDEASEGCDDTDHDGFCDSPFVIDPDSGVSDEYPRALSAAPPACAGDCFSNIFFLPGFQASRLYQSTVLGENRRWEPGALSLQSDGLALLLDANGDSINQIYTKSDAAIDQVGALSVTIDVYRTFLLMLANLKANDSISDFKVFPYDWRMSVDDIVENGTTYDNGTHFPVAELEALAAASKTGKVTILGHSNGGLVAKELMRKLEAEGKADLVDKVIFVGTPQLGTPKAVASILHGDFQSLFGGLILSQANARALGENMPGAFGLLPSAEYFARVAEPVVDLSAALGLRASAALINPLVDNAAELAQFLTGAGGRAKPAKADIESPSVLSSTLLADTIALHNDLDTWTPPSGIEVFQIAGWGLDTPRGITYTEKARTLCGFLSCLRATTTEHTVEMTEDGDGTVISTSAVAEEFEQIYYLNLNSYQKSTGHDVKHAHLTEAKSFQDLLMFLFATTTLSTLPDHISVDQPPSIISEKRLRLRVLSPVSLDAYDSFGNHTGMAPNPIPGSDLLLKEENIPNSYYEEFGEGKYIGLPGDEAYSIILKGLGTGTFTFEITPVVGGEEQRPQSYADIPVTPSTTATLTIDASGSPGPLALDQNGDGKADATVASPAQITDPLAYTKLVIAGISAMDMGFATKQQLLARFAGVAGLIPANKIAKVKERTLKMLNDIELYVKKQLARSAKQKPNALERITPEQAEALLNMVITLRSLVQ